MAADGILNGKVAIVTGAARGNGRSSAVAMAKQGATIVGIDIAGPVSATLDVTPATSDELDETGRSPRRRRASTAPSSARPIPPPNGGCSAL